MPLTDRPLAEIRDQRTTLPTPDDLGAFWERTLRESREQASEPVFVPYLPELYGHLLVDDVTFSGFGGDPVKAWLLRPRESDRPLPCLVRFIGYGGGRGVPAEHAFFAATGLATLIVDTRSQGGVVGDSGDSGAADSGAEEPGWMTRGIASPERYFYRRVFTDAVRAVETAAQHEAIDGSGIVVAGRSQGGGIAIAAAALAGPMVRACWAGVPFLCDFRHSIGIATEGPYLELVDFLAKRPERVETVERTLAYFDCAVLAGLVQAPTALTVGLMDKCCPPSSVFATFNALATSRKQIEVFEFCDHTVPPRMPEYEAAFFRDCLAA